MIILSTKLPLEPQEKSLICSEDRASYRLITLTLKKPMVGPHYHMVSYIRILMMEERPIWMLGQCMQGLVLEDNPRNRTVFVAEVVPGGHADRSGQVEVRGSAG